MKATSGIRDIETMILQFRFFSAALLFAVLLQSDDGFGQSSNTALPSFGRDTVLVWKTRLPDEIPDFVVRIAEFSPDRFIEWEDASTQGTIFMTAKALQGAKTFLNARLFEGGVDTKGKEATTLWLSQFVYKELKARGKVKIPLDSVDGWLHLTGTDNFEVSVNRVPIMIPVIKVKDERGSERWFFDLEENPLLAKHMVRDYVQTLMSITTDKPNTLRWIKGKKLAHPPQ
jgi:hypothetical protein